MPPPQPLPVNGFDGRGREPYDAGAAHRGPASAAAAGGATADGGEGQRRPRTVTNKSGKSWRHGTDDDARGSKGGNCKLQFYNIIFKTYATD